MTTIFGYPVKLTVDVDGEEVDVTAAVTLNERRPLVTIDHDEVLDLVLEHQKR